MLSTSNRFLSLVCQVLFLVSLLQVEGAPTQEFLDDIAAPILHGIVAAVSSQCEKIKEAFGLTPEMLRSGNQIDFTPLKLDQKTRFRTLEYPIGTAAVNLSSSSYYVKGNKVILLIHGFMDNPYSSNFVALNKAIEGMEGVNFLALDGSVLIKDMYLRSTTYVKFIGQKLGEVLANLTKDGLPSDKIHILGHSLGAHVAGFAGKTYSRLTGNRLGRISGLDPAGPCFMLVEEGWRLDKEDASYVDIIHTDAGVFGLNEAIGHADYYPNGGYNQPGCLLQISCSHSRALQLYAESITNPSVFQAIQCSDWKKFQRNSCQNRTSVTAVMGYASDVTTRGVFYLRTSGISPFGLRRTGLNAEIVNKT